MQDHLCVLHWFMVLDCDDDLSCLERPGIDKAVKCSSSRLIYSMFRKI